MATFNNQFKWLAGGFVVVSLSCPQAFAKDNLRDMSLMEVAEKYKDASASEIEALMKQLVSEKADITTGAARVELEEAAQAKTKAQALQALHKSFKDDLERGLGSTDSSIAKTNLANQIKEKINAYKSPEALGALKDDKEAKIEVISLGEESPFEVEVAIWKNAEGKLVSKNSIVPKEAFFEGNAMHGIKEFRKYLSNEEMAEASKKLAETLFTEKESKTVVLDTLAADYDKQLSSAVSSFQSATSLKSGDPYKRFALFNRDLSTNVGHSDAALSTLKEKASSGNVDKLAKIEKLAKGIRASRGKLEPCKQVAETLGRAALTEAEFDACYPEEAAKKAARKEAAEAKSHAQGGADKKDPFAALLGDNKGQNSSAMNPNGVNLNDPYRMQLAMQQEANTSACIGANMQLMAAAPLAELDRKFDSLLQGMESVISGSTLIPQVLVSIPQDIGGQGAYLQASNAVEGLLQDWDIRDPDIKTKVKQELRASEAATSRAAQNLESFRERLKRAGLIDPIFGAAYDSPQGQQLVKLERDLAAAGAVKESLQKVQNAIRDTTMKSFNSINNGGGRASRESQVPSVGVRVAPSR